MDLVLLLVVAAGVPLCILLTVLVTIAPEPILDWLEHAGNRLAGIGAVARVGPDRLPGRPADTSGPGGPAAPVVEALVISAAPDPPSTSTPALPAATDATAGKASRVATTSSRSLPLAR
jgi:hypothetical protein